MAFNRFNQRTNQESSMNETRNVNENNTTQEREVMKLEINPKIPFSPSYSGKFMTNSELAEIVNNCFSVIPEFKGSIVSVNTYTSELTATLFFKPLPDDSGEFVKDMISMNQNDNISTRISNMNARNRSKTIKMTRDLIDILTPLLPSTTIGFGGVYHNNNMDINNHATEIVNDIGNGREEILLQISNIDINRLLSEYHGDRNENGDYLEYRCFYRGVINPGAGTFLIDIKVLNADDLEKIGDSVGLINNDTSKSIKFVRVRS